MGQWDLSAEHTLKVTIFFRIVDELYIEVLVFFRDLRPSPCLLLLLLVHGFLVSRGAYVDLKDGVLGGLDESEGMELGSKILGVETLCAQPCEVKRERVIT